MNRDFGESIRPQMTFQGERTPSSVFLQSVFNGIFDEGLYGKSRNERRACCFIQYLFDAEVFSKTGLLDG